MNAYPTLAALRDGSLLLVFTASGPNRRGARVLASFSRDGGATWSPTETVIDTPHADVDPTIVVNGDEIQVYSTTVPEPNQPIAWSQMWKTTHKVTERSWSPPILMPASHKYESGRVHVGLHLQDGTLILPYSWDIQAESGAPARSEGEMKIKAGVLRSRDGGRTWKPGGDIFVEPPRTSTFSTGGVDEPALVELGDLSLYCLLRTSDVRLYETRSRDGGLTWDVPRASPLSGHNTPGALLRLSTGEIVVTWNNSPRHRWPLDVAISSDGARTWSRPRTLAHSPGVQSSYPSVAQAADGTIVVAWQQDVPQTGGREIRIARFSLQ